MFCVACYLFGLFPVSGTSWTEIALHYENMAMAAIDDVDDERRQTTGWGWRKLPMSTDFRPGNCVHLLYIQYFHIVRIFSSMTENGLISSLPRPPRNCRWLLQQYNTLKNEKWKMKAQKKKKRNNEKTPEMKKIVQFYFVCCAFRSFEIVESEHEYGWLGCVFHWLCIVWIRWTILKPRAMANSTCWLNASVNEEISMIDTNCIKSVDRDTHRYALIYNRR